MSTLNELISKCGKFYLNNYIFEKMWRYENKILFKKDCF